MNAKLAPTNIINALERFTQARLQVSQSLSAIAYTKKQNEKVKSNQENWHCFL